MDFITALQLAIDDHKATNKGAQDWEYTDTLRQIIQFIKLIKKAGG